MTNTDPNNIGNADQQETSGDYKQMKNSSCTVQLPFPEWTLISQGAEARVWKVPSVTTASETSSFTICKERISKSYRHPDLDAKLTKSRCRSEARLLEKCHAKGFHKVPQVLRVEPPKLFLEYVEGSILKTYLQERHRQQQGLMEKNHARKRRREDAAAEVDNLIVNDSEYNFLNLENLAQILGRLIGNLHNLDIIHGDLTTSNIMVTNYETKTSGGHHQTENHKIKKSDLMLIDFGLGKSTTSVEEQAVDLFVLERTLESTHPELPEDFLNQVFHEYDRVRGENKASQGVLQRLDKVRQRGRKRECFG